LIHSFRFFWQNGTGGLLHHDDFWDIIATNVQICRDEILSLEKGKIQLEGGGEIQCDAILCGTGWKPSLQFFEEQDLLRLDLPHLPESESSAMTEKWAQLMLDTDKKLCSMYPMLENPPPHPHTHIATTPYRLYQGMVSAQDDSILFMNHIVTGNKLFAADIQAMWAVAFFDKRIALPSVDDMDKDTALWVTYSRRRYLSSGELGNNLAFETITYTDRLLKQLGLTAHKKGMWKDMFEPFRPSDLGKAWQEYLGKLKSDK
jgi:dimethylaniline monooxygenase (N-oxide forming)